jgi:tetratricopeptide (TPR) repeat protein
MIVRSIIISFALGLQAFGICLEPSDTKLKTLYNSLDPTSISQHLAFYELYMQRSWGQQALKDVWQLLSKSGAEIENLSLSGSPTPFLNQQLHSHEIPFSGQVIQALVALVNKPIDQELALVETDALDSFIKLSTRLHHFSLRGHHIWNEDEFLRLPLEEIDVARGLFLSQFGPDKHRIQSYEALIDLMTFQILARLPKDASPEEKVATINAFIFDEMGFRFPPHSLCSQDIDLYSFLPSVLDSRRGVCLGVSILYLCIAQRLALPLEMITPPGHIYVRYCSGDKILNIETTARGIHMDSEEYLSVNTRSLQKRTIREVIGMAHFNQASAYWQNGEFVKALEAYHKAEPYMRGDPHLKELMGYLLLLTEKREEGEQLLREIKDVIPDYAIVKSTMVDDYFLGNIDAKGIAVIFSKIDEDRPSILAKKQALEKTLERYPRFRSGILCLAEVWLQLHRMGEALEVLKTYQSLDECQPEVHYYLSVLYAYRRDFPKAWFHLQQAESIVKTRQYNPKILKELRRELLTYSPE